MMMRLLVVCLVAATLLWPALAQAPDADSRCVDEDATDPSFTPYPEDQRVLFDTWNYENLGVLQMLNIDGEGSGWTPQPSLCREQLRVCDYRRPSPQNNWVFTQYISYLEAREVNVDVTYDYTSCITNQGNGCNTLQTTMYLYESNGADNAAITNPANYLQNELQVLSTTERGTVTRTFTFQPSPANTNGFYLGVEDTGTCGTINRITLYYRVCPARSIGLGTTLDIPFPPTGSTTPTPGNIMCARNSTAVNPVVSCAADSTFAGNPDCRCDPGFESMATSCSACQAPLFKALPSNDDRCIACPMNTVDPFIPAAAFCECQFSFSRPADEPDMACSRNPSSPGIVIDRLPEVTNTNVEVFWLPSQDTGGRNDFHYNVYVLLDGSTSFERRNDEPIVPATNDSNTVISYTIRNLNPEASYTIIVVASSGATNDGPSIGDLATVRDRFILFQIVAGEEAPSLPQGAVVAITFFVTAFFTALITAVIVIAVCHYRYKERRGSSGEFQSRTVTKVNESLTTSSRNGTTTELSIQKVDVENFTYDHSPPPVRPSRTPPTRPVAPPKPSHAYQYNGK